MPTKSALVLGICEYDDEKLKRLHCPDTDVKELAQVLKDSALGGFDTVLPCVNESKAGAEKAISRLFAEKGREDLVVLYFSGHGLRDDENELYLAVKDTDSRDLDGTAIAAAYIKRVMNKSNSRRQVLILDCCHSGAFATGFKGAEVLGASVGTKAAFDTDGFGRVILTASDATQYAWESERVVGESQTSLYTSFLIEGIRTGAADLSRDGMITVNELHEYVYARTLASSSKQRPTKICDKEQGALILSRAPLHAVTLPQEVEGALKSTLSSVRMAAIEELVQMFEHQSAGLALSAHQALAALRLDDSAKVRAAAEAAMLGCAGKRPDIKPELLNAIAVASDGKVEDSERVRAAREKQAADAREAEKITLEIAGKVEAQRLERENTAAKLRGAFSGSDRAPEPQRWLDVKLKMDQPPTVPQPHPASYLASLLEKQAEQKLRSDAVQEANTEGAGPEKPSKPTVWKVHGGPASVDAAELNERAKQQASLLEDAVAARKKWADDEEMVRKRKVRTRWMLGLISSGTVAAALLLAVNSSSSKPGSGSTEMASTAPTIEQSPSSSKTYSGNSPAEATDSGSTKKRPGPGAGMVEACVFDPISNVRTLPTDSTGIACRITSVSTISVYATPLPSQQGPGEWWKTDVCGRTGFIAGNQVHVGAACP